MVERVDGRPRNGTDQIWSYWFLGFFKQLRNEYYGIQKRSIFVFPGDFREQGFESMGADGDNTEYSGQNPEKTHQRPSSAGHPGRVEGSITSL